MMSSKIDKLNYRSDGHTVGRHEWTDCHGENQSMWLLRVDTAWCVNVWKINQSIYEVSNNYGEKSARDEKIKWVIFEYLTI